MKEKVTHTIVHPFKSYSKETSIDEMLEIEATLILCTIMKGVPHGPAFIRYRDPDDDELSFIGSGVFVNGKLHNAPFSCINFEGDGYTFTKMQNGRPADASYCTAFIKEGQKQHVNSKETESDVSGW